MPNSQFTNHFAINLHFNWLHQRTYTKLCLTANICIHIYRLLFWLSSNSITILQVTVITAKSHWYNLFFFSSFSFYILFYLVCSCDLIFFFWISSTSPSFFYSVDFLHLIQRKKKFTISILVFVTFIYLFFFLSIVHKYSENT